MKLPRGASLATSQNPKNEARRPRRRGGGRVPVSNRHNHHRKAEETNQSKAGSRRQRSKRAGTDHKHAPQSLGAGRSTIFRSRGLQLVVNFSRGHNKMELHTQSGKSENSNRNLEIQRTFGLPYFSKLSDFIKITRYCFTFKNHSSRCRRSILLWPG